MDAYGNGPPPKRRPTLPPEGPSAENLPSGWVPLKRNHGMTEFITTGSWLVGWIVIIGNSTNVLFPELPIPAKIGLWLAAVAVGVLAVALWYRFRPAPKVNFDTSEFRAGLRSVPMNEIRWARIMEIETKKSRSITLQFGTGTLLDATDFVRRALASYVVRTGHGQTPSRDSARLMAEVLRRSSVELPESPDDPAGKFTSFNFPGTLTRAQAVDIVLHPPALGDPLLVPQSHMHDPPRPGSER
jgi:hypothetical protein